MNEMPGVDYHGRPELSSSQVADYLEDPIKFYHQHIKGDWPKDEPTEAMRFGTAVHRMIELGGATNACKTIPRRVLNCDGHRKGKAWLDWQSANPAETYVKEGEPNPFEIIWDRLNSNKATREWLDCGVKEQEIYWTHAPTGVECRSRLDVLPTRLIVDWKTTTNASARQFQRDICDFNYDIRLAFYRLAVQSKIGKRCPVVVVAIENKPGFCVQPYEIPSDWLDESEERLDRAIEEIATFDISDYLDRPILTLEKPRWRFDDRFELERA